MFEKYYFNFIHTLVNIDHFSLISYSISLCLYIPLNSLDSAENMCKNMMKGWLIIHWFMETIH